MKRPFFFLLVGLAALASSQTPADYLHLRHQSGITHTVKSETLEGLIGSKICELDGTVKGTFKISYGAKMIQLERPSGETVVVEADALPDWMTSGEVQVRLIVRATREQEAAPLRMTLLSAATERTVEEDEATAKKPAPPAKPRNTVLQSRSESVRQIYLPPNELTPYYAARILQINPKLSREGADRIATAILAYSSKYGLDPRLIMAVVMVESSFDPNSTSRTGAMGLGQLMPGTATWMGVHDAYDSLSNIEGCVKLLYTHLKDYYHQTGDWSKSYLLMLAAYNAGEGAVKRHGGVPPYAETRAYIRHVLARYRQLCGYTD